ncbi:hypothetical protein N7509_011415 [Penicillium cosmopolitanum]|uniref:Uncharacterized protein n=1 Tax=Penicillium cosmopolitanum TaxID=1131564 RepID=A0A9W9VTF6_9EURO|nr:uncharacterized protein N7509_011415 [Penicillium cosmopolitanum]KAJ5388874.1 hypothetical protein N7509_011415 [Penicillium cosmopolitanum]
MNWALEFFDLIYQKVLRSLSKSRAYLTKLCTGPSLVVLHAKIFGLWNDDYCACGAKETVIHVLV